MAVGEMENINVNKDDKTVIKHEAKIPRYHEHVQREEARKVSVTNISW